MSTPSFSNLTALSSQLSTKLKQKQTNQYPLNQPLPQHQQLIKQSQQQQNSLELMIRAHHRIRTLQQDNQILRMHVELLTKDNQQLIEKLQKLENQKLYRIRQNEQLVKKVQELEIKMDGIMVKKQLSQMEMEKQNLCKQDRAYSAKKTVNNYIEQQNKRVQANRNLNKYNSCFQLINNQIRGSQVIHQRYEPIDFTPIKSSQYKSASQQKPYQRSLVTSPKGIKKDIQQFSKQNSKQEIQNKQKSYTCQSFYLTKDPQIRTSSPLIRKNSPAKSTHSNSICQFHPQKTTTTFSNYTTNHETNLSKKFNYTSWRRTNNKLMIWGDSTKPATYNCIKLNR